MYPVIKFHSSHGSWALSVWEFAHKINLEGGWEVSSSPSVLSAQVCELPARAARSAGGGRGQRTGRQDPSQAVCERTAGPYREAPHWHAMASPALCSGGAVLVPTHGCFPSCRPSVSLGIAFRCCFRVCLRKRITKFQKGLTSVVTESDRDSVANGQSCAVGKHVANFQIRTGLSFTGQTPCTANGFTASLWS